MSDELPPSAVASLAIGKTIRGVTSESLFDECFDLRIEFTDGSVLLLEGGRIDGSVSATFTTAAAPAREGCTPEHQHPLMTSAP